MARLTGPTHKVARRLSFSILETGQELKKRQYAPGQHGPTRRIKLSNHGLQLREKQRIRFMYQVNERQFYNTFLKATKMAGVTGHNFLFMLESRLDNVVYRLGFALTRAQARQLVNHGHILVDGKKVDIPSYRLVPGQTVSLKEASANLKVVEQALEAIVLRKEFLSYDETKKAGTFVRYPERSEVLPEIKENLIVEYYNR